MTTEDFMYHVKNCKPSHYFSDEDQSIIEPFLKLEYETFSSVILPFALVQRMCEVFCTKYGTAQPGVPKKIDSLFFVSMPLLICSSEPEATDRALYWGNGFIHYANIKGNDYLSLFVEKGFFNLITKSALEDNDA